MLNKLPKRPGTLADLLADLGDPSNLEIARALGVSARTVQRWRAGRAPRMALLSLWWLSREGHSLWDCEMERRTRIALTQADALWREVRRLRSAHGLESAEPTRLVGRPRRAANEPDPDPVQAPAA